jgi:hypothetical protein
MKQTESDWIGLAEAARLLPSCRAGKRVHLNTVWRWARKYGWPVRWLHGYRYVRRADVLGLFGPPEGGA